VTYVAVRDMMLNVNPKDQEEMDNEAKKSKK
jgi:hypothetical protein